MLNKATAFLKNHWGLLVIFGASLICLTWFGGKDYIYGDDTAIPLALQKNGIIDYYFYLWSNTIAYTGTSAVQLPFLVPIGLLLKAIQLLQLPYSGAVYERLFIFCGLFFSGVSMYVFFALVFKEVSRPVRLAAALLYMFNFYIMQLWNPLPGYIWSYTFFPLLFGLYVYWLDQKQWFRNGILLAIITLLTITPGLTNIPFLPLFFGILFAYLLVSFYKVDREHRKKAIGFYIIFAAFWFILNLFWILPLFYLLQEQINENVISHDPQFFMKLYKLQIIPISQALFFKGNMAFSSIIENSRIYPWADTYQTVVFQIIALFLPLFAFIGLTYKRSRKIFFFGCICLVTLLLVSSEYLPFGTFVSAQFIKLNLFWIFKSLYQRFMPFYTFALVILFGLGIEKIYRWQVSQYMEFVKKIILFLVCISLIFIYAYPAWTGKLHQTEGAYPSKQVTFPSYINQTITYLNNQEGEFTVLPLPFPQGLSVNYWWNDGKDGYLGYYPLLYASSKQFLTQDGNLNHLISDLTYYLYNRQIASSKKLNIFNIRYIVVHSDLNFKLLKMSEREHKLYDANAQGLQEILAGVEGLKKRASYGPISIYENMHWQPTIFYCAIGGSKQTFEVLTEKSQIDYCPQTIKEVSFISPTKYRLKLHIVAPVNLVFNTLYHPQWILHINNQNLNSKKYDGVFNSFLLDKSGDYDVVVEFRPQKVFYIGGLISILALLTGVLYLLFPKLSQKHDK